jgi:ubiquinone/menaquinone biosynthesis C-methylase UbiE
LFGFRSAIAKVGGIGAEAGLTKIEIVVRFEARSLSLTRVLEAEVMDDASEAISYDAMDFAMVDQDFVDRVVAVHPDAVKVLDLGTGTARIPIRLCQQRSQYQVLGIDLAESMLEIGELNIQRAKMAQRIRLAKADSKRTPYPNWEFDLVISNSLVHHLPDPAGFFREISRLVTPTGGIVVRDLFRPDSEAELEAIMALHGEGLNDRQAKLFRDSLHAAFTLAEVTELAKSAGLVENVRIYPSSDRHWTLEKHPTPYAV